MQKQLRNVDCAQREGAAGAGANWFAERVNTDGRSTQAPL